ncbi:MAG: glutamyl-tRNA reductase [Candidatus Omnitrophica bacterium]|nr:glutamyl-tRNA reductase [Candidatus Omnitrophota bacterium]
MNITMVGLNHRSAPIEVREKFAFSKNSLEEALTRLKTDAQIQEGVILSTCNRVEIYALGRPKEKINGALTNFLNSFHKVSNSSYEKYLYTLNGIEAIKHLFRVSSSLDSQILGETQILGQVKNAYLKARQTGAVSRVFPFVFEEAIKIGKRARSQTQIGCGAVSISTAAVEMARKIFGGLAEKSILIVGAGKIGELSAEYLYSRGAKMVLVANRTFSRAQQLAKKFNGKAIAFDEFPKAIIEADIVISSVNAPHTLIKKEMMSKIISMGKGRPVFIIDLGLPRNVAPDVNTLNNVYVYNLDDLKRVKDANLEDRLKEAEKIEVIIDNHLKKIEPKLQGLLYNEL